MDTPAIDRYCRDLVAALYREGIWFAVQITDRHVMPAVPGFSPLYTMKVNASLMGAGTDEVSTFSVRSAIFQSTLQHASSDVWMLAISKARRIHGLMVQDAKSVLGLDTVGQ
jgi:hypothetical protein